MKSLYARAVRRLEMVGDGYPPIYPAVIIAAMVAVTIAAVVQRLPLEPPWWPIIASILAALSLVLDFATANKLPCVALAFVSVVVMLLDPVSMDLIPLLLVLMITTAAAQQTPRVVLVVAACAAGIIAVAGVAGHLDSVVLYLLAIPVGWLVGYMVLSQKRLADNKVRAQRVRADQAASNERRRIAREVHDVIAHSLSITMLNVTGARRALEEGATDEALEALGDAERLGRQAMTEIRYIVKVLGSDDGSASPTPAATDIDKLVEEYRKAGIDVTLEVTGDPTSIPAPIGSALYRITQESLANVVKHSPSRVADVVLTSGPDIALRIENPHTGEYGGAGGNRGEGSGIDGMKQRAHMLGGLVDTMTTADTWVVTAVFPQEIPAERIAGR